jgi:AraC family transcriptional regulator
VFVRRVTASTARAYDLVRTISSETRRILAKIAVDLVRALAHRARDASPGATEPRTVASGPGWNVADVLCTCGPGDRAFEERHGVFCIALVVSGAFEYRSETGAALMAPGAVMLGNAGECFQCGHRHSAGDRCVAFHYQPDYFERVFADAGVARRRLSFGVPRIEPSRAFARLVAVASSAVLGAAGMAWDEMALTLAVRVLRTVEGMPAFDAKPVPAGALAHVVDTLRRIDDMPDSALGLDRLAEYAGLSPYHFLRTFERATGVTPHQYVLRARLRGAAQRLADTRDKIVDVALDSGFTDLSNFNRAFRAEFGAPPRGYRASWQRLGAPEQETR